MKLFNMFAAFSRINFIKIVLKNPTFSAISMVLEFRF